MLIAKEMSRSAITILEAATRIRGTTQYVRREIKKGHLRAIRFSHQMVRILETDYEEWIRSRQTRAETVLT